MPFKKSYRGYGKKKTYKKTYGRKLNKRQIKEVKSLISKEIEYKSFPFYGAFTQTNTPTITRLSAIPSGYIDADRVGSQVYISTLEMRYDIVVGDVYNNFRVIIFRWHENDASYTPTWADIMDDTSGSGYRYLQPYNHEQRQRYHIIYDSAKTVQNTYAPTSAGAITSTQMSYVNSVKLSSKLKFYGRRLGRKTIKFSGSTTSGMNHIYVATVSDSSLTPNPGWNYAGRILYSDA